MSLQDPIADLLTRIRNAQRAKKKGVIVSASKLKIDIVRVLKEEGYVADYDVVTEGAKKTLVIALKYFHNRPVIDAINRISKPSCQYYVSKDALPKVLGGLGISILTTSQGVMTAESARKVGIGGEVLCEVY
ncbi:MAG: 30S ribosomal protein S8 [Gammaproteobacteria bacterium]|nr:30S ribosomal protein S8 [Gammaproteobacteria bacterium]